MKDLDPKSLIIGFLTASVVWIAVYIIIGGAVGRYVPAGGSQLVDTRNGTTYRINTVIVETKEGYEDVVSWKEVMPSVGAEGIRPSDYAPPLLPPKD